MLNLKNINRSRNWARSPSNRQRLLALASLPREGRVVRQVRRCFIARGAQPLCVGDLLPWVYPQLDRFKHWHRWSVRRALLRYAVPIGRSHARGRPVIWRPNR
jgi:hypothetical protein